ncbi:lipoyl domain-containing protein [Frankia sp. QA3]|uniref:lipoyl domain-containing protein n=1 Tax=Frankia sp. QA3 TaxID=710111 RepID=UPI000269BE57|nr:lipoyl domain-containing protein [Frankia sp. QA3]EIV92353.1 pyruvate/2-oxoglutarate dehydrogenase complex, dihydrolipoamide acyltransferase component [Frankia sp. QA3]
MAEELRIPQLGVTMTEGIIGEWLADDGASVEEGQPLYVLATDKTETEIEAPAAGRLVILGVPEETYPVGTLVGRIE